MNATPLPLKIRATVRNVRQGVGMPIVALDAVSGGKTEVRVPKAAIERFFAGAEFNVYLSPAIPEEAPAVDENAPECA